MSFDLQRDHGVPSTIDTSTPPGSIRIADARLIAWAFAIGARRASADPPYRRASRRGDLPDVDFSAAAFVPRRSIWSRIAAAFRVRSSGTEAPEEPAIDVEAASRLTAESENVIPFRRAA